MSNSTPNIHEAFNARSLTTAELCKTFIVNEYFSQLASSNNSIVIGPRGSGKTTLMRMLQVQSLEIWTNSRADEIRNRVNFSGVFIPTDRLWKTQYDSIKNRFTDDVEFLAILDSSFTYHVLERLAACIEYRTSEFIKKSNNFRQVSISKKIQSELVSELAKLWNVRPQIKSFRSLEAAVTVKKQEITNYISLKIKKDKGVNPDALPIPSSPLVSILGNSIRIINNYFHEDGGKWAFLFDELELAPEQIIQPLVNSMRGGPEDIIFKLSLSPYHKNISISDGPEGSMKGHDEIVINLTTASDDSGLTFSKQLCAGFFEKSGLNNQPIEEYFEYPRQINEQKEFQELASKDETFFAYLQKQQIDPNRLDEYSESDKRPTIRKIKFIVQLRNYYRKRGGKISRRAPPQSYGGFHNICKSMEYNPRMLIGIMNDFASHAKRMDKIPIHIQLECLRASLESYNALLQTIPVQVNAGKIQCRTVYDLVFTIASYFKDEISGSTFHPEPKGSITLKKNGSIFIEAIGFALNAGALIVDKESRLTDLADVSKGRYRLSYLFSHKFGLLMTTQRKIELVDILSSHTNHNDLFEEMSKQEDSSHEL